MSLQLATTYEPLCPTVAINSYVPCDAPHCAVLARLSLLLSSESNHLVFKRLSKAVTCSPFYWLIGVLQ